MSYILEEWKPVVGYEGIYEVSCLGRICRVLQSPGTVAGTILKQHKAGRKLDYNYVCLSRNGKLRNHAVHRLVALAFLGPCPSGHNVNHIDGDKGNPTATNLEYVTPERNQQHAVRTGLQSRKLSDDVVRSIRRDLAFASQSELARRHNVRPQTIWKIANHRINHWLD